MEILLLIALIATAAAGLFMAATFNKRIRDNVNVSINDSESRINDYFKEAGAELRSELQEITGELHQSREVVGRLQAASGGLGRQLQTIADELRRGTELVRQLQSTSAEPRQQIQQIIHGLARNAELVTHVQATSAELRQQAQAVTDELQQNKELLKHLDERIGARQNQLERDTTQLDHRLTGLGESLAEQGARISAIHRYVARRETQSWSSAENGSLLLAVLEAESNVDSKGWGGRPYLYALTASADALVVAEQERLPDGVLTDAVGGVHWPADVVGCVLVAELAALPPGSEEDADVAVGASDWTSPHPDGRPVRIAVGVGRDGSHQCGFRIKGDDEVQVRPALASDLVTALLGAF